MKKIKTVLSFLLSIIICFSVFPTTVFAAAERTVTHAYLGIFFSDVPVRSESSTLPITITDKNHTQSQITDIEVVFDISNCTSDSTLTVTYVFNGGGAYRIQSFDNVQACYRTSAETGEIVDISDYSYNASTGTFTYSVDVGAVAYDGFCEVTSWLGVASTINGSANAWARLTNVTVTSESQEKGFQNKIAAWFNNLFQWLKDIRDNLTNMSTNVGKWFTDLKNNIQGFFTDLGNKITNSFTEIKNNLQTWFDNVGQWFNTLGDNIKGFFDNLWNNITDKVNNIELNIKNWWQSVVDWFNNLFKVDDEFFNEYVSRWDEWLSTHFGVVYQVVTLPVTIVQTLIRRFNYGYDSVVYFPEIKLPWGNHVLVNSYSFDLEAFYNSNTIVASLFVLLKTFINAVILVAFINALIKFWNKNIMESEGD